MPTLTLAVDYPLGLRGRDEKGVLHPYLRLPVFTHRGGPHTEDGVPFRPSRVSSLSPPRPHRSPSLPYFSVVVFGAGREYEGRDHGKSHTHSGGEGTPDWVVERA